MTAERIRSRTNSALTSDLGEPRRDGPPESTNNKNPNAVGRKIMSWQI